LDSLILSNVQQKLTEDLYSRFIHFIDVKPTSVCTYSNSLKQFFLFLSSKEISVPTRNDILSFKAELKSTGHKPTTIQNYIAAIRLFFQWTEQEHLYPNIAERIKGGKIDKEHKKDYLTSKQVKNLLYSTEHSSLQGKRNYAMLALMITCGLRTIEIVRADIGDLRTVGDNTVLFIQGKGREDKNEYVKITDKVENIIRDYLKERGESNPHAALFTSTSHNNRNQRMTTRSIRGIVKTKLVESGYNSERLTAHSLRHTAVTLSLLSGKPLEEVQQFARHLNISTTMIYNHALDKAKNSCSEAITNAIFQ